MPQGQQSLQLLASKPVVVTALLVGSSGLALCYNVCHAYVLQVTDPVSICVLGNLKVVLLIMASEQLLPGASS